MSSAPVAQATPARDPRLAPELLMEHLPGNAATKDDTCETRAIREARPPTCCRFPYGQEPFERAHNGSGGSVIAMLVHASRRRPSVKGFVYSSFN